MDTMTTIVQNQSSELEKEQKEEQEETEKEKYKRIVLDLYEKDGKTPKIHLDGRKSQLLRCLTGNQAFKSGNRPTTYMAIGTLCKYNNDRYWIIDTPVNSDRVQIVFTAGLIDDEPDNDPDTIRSICAKGFNIANLKTIIDETMNDHWENIHLEQQAIEQVYVRTAKFIYNIRPEYSDGTEYHYFSFDDFRRFTFNKIGETVPDDFVKDSREYPLLLIRQLYKNSTKAEKARTYAIETKFPELKTKPCNINSDNLGKTLERTKLVIRNPNDTDNVPFKVDSSCDFVYLCKTGQQSPLDNFWTTYNLNSILELTGYSERALSYFTHSSVNGATQSVCRTVGKYPIVDVVICAVNC
ncbi:unnamed protein product [Rotaria sp. Silwood1]|nr:unnamed protein product [Rotaria sp. Silwood1]